MSSAKGLCCVVLVCAPKNSYRPSRSALVVVLQVESVPAVVLEVEDHVQFLAVERIGVEDPPLKAGSYFRRSGNKMKLSVIL